MHTNIDLDESLVTEAMRLTNAKTKKEVIHLGLRELVRLAQLNRVRSHRGKFNWHGNLQESREGETHDIGRSLGRHKRSH